MKVTWDLSTDEVDLLEALAAEEDLHPSQMGRTMLAELLRVLMLVRDTGTWPISEIAFRVMGKHVTRH